MKQLKNQKVNYLIILKIDFVYEHEDTHQIEVDVNRSLFNFDITNNYNEEKMYFLIDLYREGLRNSLKDVLLAVVCTDSNIHYYQGLHDIAATLLITCGQNVAFSTLKQLCHTFFLYLFYIYYLVF